MAKVSAAIMAHPARRDLVDGLLGDLGPLPVAWDQIPPTQGLTKGDRVWSVAREAWLAYDPAADWHVLIQDDAVVCEDFLAGLEVALDHVPGDALVSLYFGKGANVPPKWRRLAADADRAGASWVKTTVLMWGVCMAVPTPLVAPMVAWCDLQRGQNDDRRVGRWFRAQGLLTWYTWPSLADHHLGPSLVRNTNVVRVAARHHQGSALALDWAGPVISDREARDRG